MIKVPHQNSFIQQLDKSYEVSSSQSCEGGESIANVNPMEVQTDKAMSLDALLKIAEFSRKYGPLFYQDALIMESLGFSKDIQKDSQEKREE